MKFKLFIFCSLFFSFGFSQIKTKNITEFSQKDTKEGILVDVRTQEEFNEGHLKGALHMDWFAKDFIKQFAAIGKDKNIYLYCRSGNRSGKAAHVLDSIGYKSVTNLNGGYKAWLLKLNVE
ncbi:MAG: rhodanese-like domain-containing protein [Cellulophaga sp.]